jgi:hypothetical protein
MTSADLSVIVLFLAAMALIASMSILAYSIWKEWKK